MKFIADTMVGRLARYLRASGYDVIYCSDIDDRQLVNIAAEQNRAILTRDSLISSSLLYKQKKPALVLIESEDYIEQLTQLKRQLRIPLKPVFNRCIECNCRLKKIDKKEFAGSIPSYVYRTCNEFMRCPCCRKIFWQGSHCKSMAKILQSLE